MDTSTRLTNALLPLGSQYALAILAIFVAAAAGMWNESISIQLSSESVHVSWKGYQSEFDPLLRALELELPEM